MKLHVDHVLPVSLGGLNQIDNLVTACQGCNLGKHARPALPPPAARRKDPIDALFQMAELLAVWDGPEIWRQFDSECPLGLSLLAVQEAKDQALEWRLEDMDDSV